MVLESAECEEVERELAKEGPTAAFNDKYVC